MRDGTPRTLWTQTGGTPEWNGKIRKSQISKDSCCGCPYFSLETTNGCRGLQFSRQPYFLKRTISFGVHPMMVTQLLHCEQCNVFVLLQRIKRFIVDPVLQKIILRDIPLPHRFPKRAEINQTVPPPFSQIFYVNYRVAGLKSVLWIYPQ